MALGTNWAGSYAYRAHTLHRPETIEQLQEIVAAAPRIRVLGSRHTFSDIADSDELVSLAGLPPAIEIGDGTVSLGGAVPYGELAATLDERGLALHNLASLPHTTVAGAVATATRGAVRYGELAPLLDREGVALHNLASLPHTTIAGAVATATHGSGGGNGNLATAVAAVELVTSTGEVITAARGDENFDALVVNLGALGAVTRLTLDVEPAYEIRQRVFEGLEYDALVEHYDEITSLGHSVSVFTRWGDRVDQVWVKSRVTDAAEEVRDELYGAVAATVERHPIIGLDPVNCTKQLGVPGPWWDRLPHFRMGFTPSNGEELQSEYLLPRTRAREAIEAVRPMADAIGPLLQVCELRTVAADELWLSPQYGQDTIGVHFTWVKDPDAVERVLPDIEAALLDLDGRPHWGKKHAAGADVLAPRYPGWTRFQAVRERLDPTGVFTGPHLQHVLGPAAAMRRAS
jgi:xylitol oxidase